MKNGIGDMEKMAYAWYYMFLPLVVKICLVYVIASKKFRHQVGDDRWGCWDCHILLIFQGD